MSRLLLKQFGFCNGKGVYTYKKTQIISKTKFVQPLIMKLHMQLLLIIGIL